MATTDIGRVWYDLENEQPPRISGVVLHHRVELLQVVNLWVKEPRLTRIGSAYGCKATGQIWVSLPRRYWGGPFYSLKTMLGFVSFQVGQEVCTTTDATGKTQWISCADTYTTSNAATAIDSYQCRQANVIGTTQEKMLVTVANARGIGLPCLDKMARQA